MLIENAQEIIRQQDVIIERLEADVRTLNNHLDELATNKCWLKIVSQLVCENRELNIEVANLKQLFGDRNG